VQTTLSLRDQISTDEVLELYRANHWSAAEKPEALLSALRNSHALVTARVDGRLVGLGNAISDDYLVVYFPHMLVHPDFQARGIGGQLMRVLLEGYTGFHQLMLTADGDAIRFYERMGFVRAGHTEPMWVYAGNEH